MLHHTFKQIARSLWLHKSFTLINLLGLSIGIAAVVVIFLIADYEKSFDTFHSETNKVYRVVSSSRGVSQEVQQATVPYPMGRFLRQEYEGIEATQIHFSGSMTVNIDKNDPFREKNVVFADSLFFRVLDFEGIESFWLAGNQATALSNPGQAIVTENTAQRYFGNQNPIGRRIRLDNKVYVEVVGVVKEAPPTNHLPFSMLVSFSTLNQELMSGLDINSWGFTANGFTYVRLDENTSRASIEAALQAIEERNADPDRASKKIYSLQPIAQIHFDPTYENSNKTYTVSSRYLNMLLLLGGFIILIACVNYINLSTSFAFTKSKEVGIRKTIGASKGQLFFHYMMETLTVTLSASLLGIILALLMLPTVNQILRKSISAAALLELPFIIGGLLAVLLITFNSGAYPALVLAGFNPISSLKNQLVMPGKFSVVLRKGLVIFQFVISVVLIIASMIISNQMSYLREKDLGFIKDQQLVIPLRSENAKGNYASLKNVLSNHQNMEAAGASYYYPGIFNPTDWMMYKEGNSMQNAKSVYMNFVDDTFLQTLGLQPVAGRLFSPQFPADTNATIVLNKKGVAEMGFSSAEEAVGKWVAFDWEGEQHRFTIVGVVNDFHFKDLSMPIEPYGFLLNNSANQNYLITHVAGENIGGTLSAIEKAWNGLNPNEPFEYSFLDQDFQKNYEAESRLASMIRYFTIIAILISCLGLFGLATFSAEQRIKEIGIRKVLGASVANLVALLSFDFLKLVILAVVLASPIAWYVMQEWLQTFAYRVSISWEVFALTTFLAIMIALLTVSFQAIKAALVNPVNNLRTE
jgi:putative ABC transport system permease protein